VLSINDVKLHVLSEGNEFDLQERRPGAISRHEALEVQVQATKAAEVRQQIES
jgi:hypothetical protein